VASTITTASAKRMSLVYRGHSQPKVPAVSRP
jgi:hypothetical protein